MWFRLHRVGSPKIRLSKMNPNALRVMRQSDVMERSNPQMSAWEADRLIDFRPQLKSLKFSVARFCLGQMKRASGIDRRQLLGKQQLYH